MKRTVWHFISEDGYEDYALSPEDRDALEIIYTQAGTVFTIETSEEDCDGDWENDYDESPLFD